MSLGRSMRAAAVGIGVVVLAVSLPACSSTRSVERFGYPGTAPGGSSGSFDGQTLSLSNDAISMSWDVTAGMFSPLTVEDKVAKRLLISEGEVFSLVMADGEEIGASGLVVTEDPTVDVIMGEDASPCLAKRSNGLLATVKLTDDAGQLEAVWQAELRNGSNYIRQSLAITAKGPAIPIRDVVMVDVEAPGAKQVGSVKGSVVVAGDFFFGVEHPMARNNAEPGAATLAKAAASETELKKIRCSLPQNADLQPGQSITETAVVGVVPEGQLRRGFLHYVERERAHPYRTFLHYNSWYDIGYGYTFDEQDCIDVVEAYGEELGKKRGVTIDSMLFDDGWDDTNAVWEFHDGLPNGFEKVRQAAGQYDVCPGVWLSPWGGYGKARDKRVAAGGPQGYEIENGRFVLSGPKYYKRFYDVCMEMVRKYDVNQFKFDGVGRETGRFAGSRFGSDFEAAIELIDDLRVERPDIYINLTTGTWPSPFWLQHADSIWRGGADHSFAGAGTKRQQWITYRDSQTYKNIVKGGPLFPLSSLMLHGVIYAKGAEGLQTDPGDDLRDEIRSGFGSGTQLQELYITPALLSEQNWDDLAKSAKWARENAATLRDTHWVGGDPVRLEVYGWASWSQKKGILVLRNPSEKAQQISIDVAAAFELPEGAARRYALTSPYYDQRVSGVSLDAGVSHTFSLEPFEVLVFDAMPQ